MSDTDFWDLIKVMAVMLAVGLAIGCGVGSIATGDSMREAAVKAGVGEWQVDAKTGVTTFVYKKGGCQ